MAFDSEKRVASHLLDLIENGRRPLADIRPLLEESDPALVYFLFAWLRVRYHGGHSASEGVLGRVVGLLAFPSVAKLARTGEKDALVAWFQESHDYAELQRDDFISLIVDKLEG